MISTLRDAELQIEALKRQQNELIKELRSLKLTEKSKSNGNVVQTPVEIDSQLNADQNTINHKLYHIFDRIKTRVLEIVNLTLDTLTAITINTTNLNSTNMDATDIDTTTLEFDIAQMNQYIKFFNPSEGRIQIVGGNIVFTRGAYFDGANWFATDTTAILYILAPSGLYMYYNTGLAVGPYAPIQRLLINANIITPNRALMVDGSGALMTPGTAFSGTVWVSGTNGGATNMSKTFVNGVCTS